MAELLTPKGLVVGLIPEKKEEVPEEPKAEVSEKETPETPTVHRGHKRK